MRGLGEGDDSAWAAEEGGTFFFLAAAALPLPGLLLSTCAYRFKSLSSASSAGIHEDEEDLRRKILRKPDNPLRTSQALMKEMLASGTKGSLTQQQAFAKISKSA